MVVLVEVGKKRRKRVRRGRRKEKRAGTTKKKKRKEGGDDDDEKDAFNVHFCVLLLDVARRQNHPSWNLRYFF